MPDARQVPLAQLPDEVLLYLLGSRYCETDRLTDIAWQLFGQVPQGWELVQAIVAYVHHHIRFDYMSARPTKTAWTCFTSRWACAAIMRIWRLRCAAA